MAKMGLHKLMTAAVVTVSGILILFFLLLIRSMNAYTRPKGPEEICINGICLKGPPGQPSMSEAKRIAAAHQADQRRSPARLVNDGDDRDASAGR
jgi:hypothetical protein